MAILKQAEIEVRLRARDNAIASQRLEGLEVDAQTFDALTRAAHGEIDVCDVLNQLHERLRHEVQG